MARLWHIQKSLAALALRLSTVTYPEQAATKVVKVAFCETPGLAPGRGRGHLSQQRLGPGWESLCVNRLAHLAVALFRTPPR